MDGIFLIVVGSSRVPSFKNKGTFYRDKQDEQDDSSLGLTGDEFNPDLLIRC
jgi:hypothetical protein